MSQKLVKNQSEMSKKLVMNQSERRRNESNLRTSQREMNQKIVKS